MAFTRRLSSYSLQRLFSSKIELLKTDIQLKRNPWTILVPLPNKTGLTTVELNGDSTIVDLQKKLHEADKSVAKVLVVNENGQKLAGNTLLSHIPNSFSILLDDWKLQIIDINNQRPPQFEQFEHFEHLIVSKPPGSFIDNENFRKMCMEHGAIETSVQLWRNTLLKNSYISDVDNGIVVGFDSESMKQRVLSQAKHLEHQNQNLNDELKELSKKETEMTTLLNNVHSLAHRNITIKKWTVLGGMLAQFGTLFYFVFDVFSWDIMEPFSYFLMMTYVLGGSVYFALKKKDVTYTNLLQAAFVKQEQKFSRKLGYNSVAHEELHAKIQKKKAAIELLRSRLA